MTTRNPNSRAGRLSAAPTGVIALVAALASLAPVPSSDAAAVARGSLAGKVFDKHTEALVADVTVAAYALTSGEEFHVVTDANGSYLVEDAPTGVYSFTLAAEGEGLRRSRTSRRAGRDAVRAGELFRAGRRNEHGTCSRRVRLGLGGRGARGHHRPAPVSETARHPRTRSRRRAGAGWYRRARSGKFGWSNPGARPERRATRTSGTTRPGHGRLGLGRPVHGDAGCDRAR